MPKVNELVKQFFGPTLKSAVLKWTVGTILLFLVTFIIVILSPDLAEWDYGWPLHFLEVRGFAPDWVGTSFNLFYLIIDVLFWYLVVCIMYLLMRIRRLNKGVE
jgi:hypothetical protein